MASPTPLGVHQIASGETYALVADLNQVGITADAAMTFVKARAEYLTDKAVADAGALSRKALNELPGRVESEVDRVIGDTREDAAEARSIAQQAYEYNQTLIAPVADVVNAIVTDPATAAGELVAGKAGLAEFRSVTTPPAAKNPITGAFMALHAMPARKWSTTDGAANRAAIQACIDAAAENRTDGAGYGGVVMIHRPPEMGPIPIAGSLQLRGKVTITGEGWTRHDDGTGTLSLDAYTLKGDGVNPLFVTGVFDGSSEAHSGQWKLYEGIRLRDLSATNMGAPVVEFFSAMDYRVDGCDFYARVTDPNRATVDARQSYRGSIRDSKIRCEGGGWAISQMYDANGTVVDHCICSGYSLGGAIRVGRGAAAVVTNNIIESSRYGIALASLAPVSEGNGSLHAPIVTGNYMEMCGYPLMLGEVGAIFGGQIAGNFVSFEGSADPEAMYGATDLVALRLGSLMGTDMRANRFLLGNRARAVRPLYRAGVVPYIATGVDLTGTTWTNPKGAAWDLSQLTTGSGGQLGGGNCLPLDGVGVRSTRMQQHTTDTITANVGTSILTIAGPSQLGRMLHSVEVLEATGDLTGAEIRIGIESNSSLNASVKPATLSLSRGYARVERGSAVPIGEALNLYVVKGSGTGTFRVRITWQGE